MVRTPRDSLKEDPSHQGEGRVDPALVLLSAQSLDNQGDERAFMTSDVLTWKSKGNWRSVMSN